MIRWLRALFAWRTTYENDCWWRRTNKVTGEHRWLKRPYTPHSPIPLIDDAGQPLRLGRPPRPNR